MPRQVYSLSSSSSVDGGIKEWPSNSTSIDDMQQYPYTLTLVTVVKGVCLCDWFDDNQKSGLLKSSFRNEVD